MAEKILVLDIETAPAQAYVWRAYGEQNIGVEQLIDPGRIICVGMKVMGQKGTKLAAEWNEGGYERMLREVHLEMSEADAVVTYNGDRFDLPKLVGAFLQLGLPPLPPVTSIDVLKTVKKFGLLMNKLAFVGPLLVGAGKMKHEGFALWVKVMEGDKKAQARMSKYCIQDVVLLEKLYLRVRPYMKNHPHLGDKAHQCGACKSNHVQSRGYRRTKYFRIQRLQCQNCGAWQDGKREKVA